MSRLYKVVLSKTFCHKKPVTIHCWIVDFVYIRGFFIIATFDRMVGTLYS